MSPDTVLAYLLAMEEEGCTATDVVALTDNETVPLVLHHDGNTCPIHER